MAYIDKLTGALGIIEEAFIETKNSLDEAVEQAHALLLTCPRLPLIPRGRSVPHFICKTGFILKGLDGLTARPWPKGF
jgi:hypothetical protein